MRLSRSAALAAGLLLAALAATPSSFAWVAGPTAPHHADLAVMAAQRLHAPYRDLLLEHEESFRRGALDPDGIAHPDRAIHTFYHAYEPSDGGGGGVYRVQLSLYEAAMAIRRGAAPEDVAYQMGVLTHFVMDLSMPFHTGEDDYDNRWHEATEIKAYEHRDQIEVRHRAPPREAQDVKARAVSLAEASARLADPLIASLDAADAPWTPEAAHYLSEAATMGVEATADLLLTAFLWGSPDRPEPRPLHDDELPVPKDAEDLGLSLTELAKHHPWVFAAAGFAMTAALVGVVAWLLAQRRASRG